MIYLREDNVVGWNYRSMAWFRPKSLEGGGAAWPVIAGSSANYPPWLWLQLGYYSDEAQNHFTRVSIKSSIEEALELGHSMLELAGKGKRHGRRITL